MKWGWQIGWFGGLGLARLLGQELAPAVRSFADASSGPASRAHLQAPAIPLPSREAVVREYQEVYLASGVVPADWTGNRTNCTAGTTSAAYAIATVQRLNFFRFLAGLPEPVSLNPDWSLQCQEAALMMSAQRQLSHAPAPGWACYTAAGAEAAGRSNLALGVAGPAAIDFYFDDPGTGNAAVGHRRWLLYPPLPSVGTGSLPAVGGVAANALWVIGLPGPRPAEPAWIAWPPPGFIPYRLLPVNSKRWSFSLPNADFSGAVVAMNRGGVAVPVTLEVPTSGYGDNTLVWVASGVSPAAPVDDVTYLVTVGNVRVEGVARAFTYKVTVIDPARVVPPPVLAVRVEGLAVMLTWPGSATGYTLQRALELGDVPTWQNVSSGPELLGNEWRVTLGESWLPEYFRLKR